MEEIVKTLERMEKKIDDQKNEIAGQIAGLHAILTSKIQKIDDLEIELIDVKKRLVEVEERAVWQDQRNRNMCVKVHGVQIDKDLEECEGHIPATIDAVFSKVFGPILQRNPSIKAVPSPDEIIEVAHKLYSEGKKDPKTNKVVPPVIHVRFRSKEIRDIIMRNRKGLKDSGVDRNEKKAGVQNYWVTEDLTKDIQKKLQECIAHKLVLKAWSIDGKLRLILKAEPTKVIKLKSHVFDIEKLKS